MQSNKRKALTSFFVLRPWGFVLFLLLGAGLFVFTAANIKIPVYTKVETAVTQKNGVIQLSLHNKSFQAG